MRSSLVSPPADRLTSSPLPPQLDDYTLTPATLRSIEIHGARNTRRSLLDHVFNPVIEESARGPTTIGELLARLNQALNKLYRLGTKPQPRKRACPLPLTTYPIS